ncbi:polyketide synthase [Herbaspirillum rubrisubalbicans M1]|uniref:hybrid non-ribosomal peptide synthetase/type I polyketide synthase n=1 Tax=Herbaspirillum rubrisubalbicans TaxID=80842 RepID=UPI00073A25D6|nr:hybrid non-ribosomal peptide synthetase/type I polyketide synthase [Herbaspirillum rubrisubalbicans]ALU89427.1 polyketide synthase [Herbaspirillum rubrisubalbicans M1]
MTDHAHDLSSKPALPDWLEHWARQNGEREALHFSDSRQQRLSYGELSERVRAHAAALQQRWTPGTVALILFPSGLDYVVSLLACFYAGIIAVPVNLPGAARVKRVLAKIDAISDDCKPAFVLTGETIEQASGDELKQFAARQAMDIVHLESLVADAAAWQRPDALNAQAIAFLQYTSGSTGLPKGVVNRHGQLLHNIQFQRRLLAPQGQSCTVASWLPLFHDLGLIMGILAPLALGGRALYMPPMSFVAAPLDWLLLASRERATVLPCPSFALRSCVSALATATPQQRRELDLSSVHCLMPAAEPVLPVHVQGFIDAFAPYGLTATAMRPAYGLAEATLVVSANTHDRGPCLLAVDRQAIERDIVLPHPPQERARWYVGNGDDFGAQEVLIVDPEHKRCLGQDKVGEIWVRGPSVAGGYWGKNQNDEAFAGTLVDAAPGEHPFLRTGDMGFLHEGQLFVTGRRKDMMIFRGQCHYPNDIEASASQCHALAVEDSAAAFSLSDDSGEDRLVIVQEVRKSAQAQSSDYADLAATIRQTVAQEHQLSAHAIILIRKGTLPRTTSGKIRRRTVRQSYLARELVVLHEDILTPAAPMAAPTAPAFDLSLRGLGQWLAQHLGNVSARSLDPEVSLFQYGLDSMSAVELTAALGRELGRNLPDDLLYQHPSIHALLRQLRADLEPGPAAAAPQASDSARTSDIAIIGMGLRLPGPDGADIVTEDALWDMLVQGKDAIRSMPARRFRQRDDIPGLGSYLEDIDRFDAPFFKMSPREAINTDPQQRLLLEECWHALENAGLTPSSLKDSDTGVFVGIGTADYGHLPFASADPAHLDAYYGTGTVFAAAAGRLSFHFDWHGPAMSVDTACSSAHSALHLAVQSLRAGECPLAVAAGVKLHLVPEIDVVLNKAGMLAADGRCKTMDAAADGYVRGEGCLVLVLKPLQQALADGNTIRAVIRDTTVRQDGSGSSLSAPNGQAQFQLLRRSLQRAGLSPAQIDYVEMHGTGTRLGDPIEYDSLAQLFAGRADDDPLWLGSIKTNIGHLEAAAGAAGIVKTILALEKGLIPPLVGLNEVNPLVDLQRIPARLPTAPQAWPQRAPVRRAGVTSYGFTGTIAHVVLEQAPPPLSCSLSTGQQQAAGPYVFHFSAQTETALRQLLARYHAHLLDAAYPPAHLANTLARQREHLPVRQALVAQDIAQLRTLLAQPVEDGTPATQPPRIAMMFTGQGAQYIGMGRQLHEQQPVFRAALDEVDTLMLPYLGRSIIDLMHHGEEALLQQTCHAQPALFAIEYALARLWLHLGVAPVAVMGHSIGEFAAMVIAGALPLEQACRLIVRRGQLMQALPEGGKMLAARLTEAQASDHLRQLPPALQEELAIAAINGQQDVVFSGSGSAIAVLAEQLAGAGCHCRALSVSHAFHSPLLDPMLQEWEQECQSVTSSAPATAMLSTLTGSWLQEAPSAHYLRQHAREPVRFHQALQALAEVADVVLEVGPHAVLTALAQRSPLSSPVQFVASLLRQQDDGQSMAHSCAALYRLGQDFLWEHSHPGATVAAHTLPSYPFDRHSYWLEYDEDAPRHAPLALPPRPLPAQAAAVPLYQISWEAWNPPQPKASDPAPGLWLASARQHGGASAQAWRWFDPDQQAQLPGNDDMLVFLARASDEAAPFAHDDIWHLVRCLQTLQRHARTPAMVLLTERGQAVAGNQVHPGQAALWGSARALALEYPAVRWLMIDSEHAADLDWIAAQAAQWQAWLPQENALAWRQGQWWTPRLAPLPEMATPADATFRADPAGLYLVAGANGALGRHMVDWLARHGARHLVLLARQPASGVQARRLALLQQQGIRIDQVQADIAEAASMQQAWHRIAACEEESGHTLSALFHCAGTSVFRELALLTPEDYERVSCAKVEGAWNLHRLSLQRPQASLICFSSISGIWGSRLQVPYGAANAFEDALIRLRRQQGLPGMAIAWGPWGGGGMSDVDESLLQLLRAAGIRRLSPEHYLQRLGQLLSCPSLLTDGCAVAVQADWSRLIALMTLYQPLALFSRCQDLLGQRQPGALEQALDTADRAALAAAIPGFVTAELSRILRMSPAELTPDASLLRLGMDSILIMELARQCELTLGIRCELKALFEHTTAASLTDYLLQQAQQQVQASASASMAAAEPIHADPAQADQPFVLTELQHAYWVGRQSHYALGGVACHAYLEADAVHGLDSAQLERCWNVLIARHGALRIVIGSDGLQRILPQTPHYAIQVADCRQHSQAQTDALQTQWRQAMSHQVMDSQQWPLFDVRVMHCPEGRSRLFIGIDMLINDATSGQILWEELAALYQADGDAQAAGLRPFSISFRDYIQAKYQHSTARQAAREQARQFWLEQLPSLPAAPQLPLRHEALQQHQPRFSRRQHRLDAHQWSRLREQAASVNCTPAALLITAFAEVLAAWSSEKRFTLNLTTFDRLPWHEDVPHLLGDFTAVTLLPLDLSSRSGFAQRAAAVNGSILGYLQHRAFSAVDVLREWNRGRERAEALSMPVVFTSQLGMSDPTKGAARQSPLGEVVYGISQTPQVWLDHQACEQEGALVFNWDVIDDLFLPGVVDAMFDAYCTLLHYLAADPAHWETALPAMLPLRQQQVRQAVNDTPAPLPQACLDQLFFSRAQQQPEQLALVSREGQWRYGQLAQWAQRLSQALLAAGVRPGDRVAVLMQKCSQQVAACLAIQQCGAAYVPVDSSTPASRLHSILAGSTIRVVLSRSAERAHVQSLLDGQETILLEADEDQLASYPAHTPEAPRNLHDAAYVIYTSGSTGTPKGVLIDHMGAANTVLDINRRFGITAGDKVLGLSSLYFDLSVYDIFGTLAAGGTLVLPDHDKVRDPGHWLRLVQEHGVTVWNSVPALLELLLDSAEQSGQSLPGLRHVLLSGDWISLGLPPRLRQAAPASQLIAMGGATEASIWSNWFAVQEVAAHWRSIPYGKPLSNQAYHVLDAHGQPCPDYVTGDLYIAGIGLAVGYENDAQKTADSFIHMPDGQRLYRTGDLARYWTDGNLEFLGRRDFQVKIAGNRIELGDIEAALLRCPGVREAVVDTIGTPPQLRLAAWVVPQGGPSPILQALESPFIEPERLWQDILSHSQQVFAGQPAQAERLQDFWQLMDQLGLRMMHDTLAQAGIADPAGCSADELMQQTGAAPVFFSLLQRWRTLLAAQSTPLPGWAELRALASVQQLPATVLDKLQHSAALRLAILRQQRDAMELFYSSDETLSPEQLTQLNPLATCATAAMAEAIRRLARASAQPLRILEVGGRSGLAAQQLLLQLVGCPLHYHLSDPSRTLLEQARQRLSAHPHPEHQFSFELTQAPQHGPQAEHDMDLVVAFNALHRERDIAALLHALRQRLAPGACLLAVETTRNSHFQLATVALLEQGYTQFADQRQHSGDALLSADQWVSAFNEAGWERAGWSGIQPAPLGGLALLLAQQCEHVYRFQSAPLQQALQQLLPAYMVPGALMALDELPLSATGKVDRKRLPRPAMRAALASATSAVADSPLAQLWQQALGVSTLTPDSDFFALGGDSLIAVRLIERIRHTLHANVALTDLFEASGFGAFERRVLAAPAMAETHSAGLQPDPAHWAEPFPLTDVQQAYWIGRKAGFELGGISTHIYAEIEVEGFSIEQLQSSWQAVVRRHGMLRAVISDDGLQQCLPEVPPYVITYHDLRQADDATRLHWQEQTRQQLSHAVHDTTRWPLFAIHAASLDAQRIRICISLDNLICDGRSMRLILAEWSARLRHPEQSWPLLSASFRDYVLFREAQPVNQQSLHYWLTRLQQLPPPPVLPMQARASDALPHFTRRQMRLSADRWQRLQGFATQRGLTINALLLTAYAELIAHWSARADFTLSLTLFNRPAVHADIDGMVGDFTSLVLFAFDARTPASFQQRATAVQGQMWQDLEHQDVSAVRVLREAARQRGQLNMVAAPVVFTSGLGVAQGGDDHDSWLGDFVYSVSQTPQVWLDQQLVERHGRLELSWDSVDGLFPEGLLDEMFHAYELLLHTLADHDSAWATPATLLLPERHARLLESTASAPAANDAAPQAHLPEAIADQLTSLLGELVELPAHLLQRRDALLQTNFFELGASSLELIRLHQRLQHRFDLTLPVVDVFSHTTLASLATHLGRLAGQQQPADPAAAPDSASRLERRRNNDRAQKRRALSE